jgi:predicted PurR-regulated permease PerM
MRKEQIVVWFFIAIFVVLLYVFLRILKPFIWPLFWAGTLSLLLYPVSSRLTRLVGGRAGLSALVMTVFSAMLVMFPLFIVTAVLAVEMFDVYRELQAKIEVVRVPELAPLVGGIKKLLPLSVIDAVEKRFEGAEFKPEQIVIKGAEVVSRFVFSQVQSAARNFAVFVFNFFIMTFALFFFFRDGRRILENFKSLIPMRAVQKDRIFLKFYEILFAVVIGVMATAAVQGLLAGFFFWVLGISFPVLAGTVTFVFSLLPVGGAVLVWLPVGVYLILTGSPIKGVALLALGAGVISSIDNFLKPLIIGGRAKLPTLFLLLSILGSIDLFGFAGIILGPVILAVLFTFSEIYKEEYRLEGEGLDS